MQELLDEIKESIRPKSDTLNKVDSFVSKINSILKNQKIKANCVRGGSTAKGTFLKDDHDIDLFVIFDYSFKGKDISQILSNKIESLNVSTVHGSRDYFQLEKDGLTYEIVPVLEVKNPEDVENVTDMSPHHVGWVQNKLNKRLQDDIRLAKKFCKACKVYGAESYIKGFSGHVLDILVIYYGGFVNLLKASIDWAPKVVIDIENHWENPIDSIDISKTSGPIILIDPIQKYRNAAAGLSLEKFNKFKITAKEFISKPLKKYFVEKDFDIDKISINENEEIIILDLISLDGKTDVVGSKIMKSFDYIKSQLKKNNFIIISSEWKWDKKRDAQMYFVVDKKILSKTFVRTGPPISEKNPCLSFLQKNLDTFQRNDRYYANVIRKYRKPKNLLKDIINNEYIVKKVEKIKIK